MKETVDDDLVYLQESGVEVEEDIGDAAYSTKKNINYAQENHIDLIAKLNPSISHEYRKDEDQFEFNNYTCMYICPADHMAVRKARQGKKNQAKNQKDTYYFDVEKCKRCPSQEGCYKPGAKSKTYSVSLKSKEHTEQLEFQNSNRYFS